MGKRSQAKGRVAELELCRILQGYGFDAEKFHDGLPAVFHRKNRAEWLVTMPLDAWIALYEAVKKP